MVVVGFGALFGEEVETDLFVDDGGEVGGYNFVVVAVAYHQPISVRDRQAGDGVSFGCRNRGRLERTKVEEHGHFGHGGQFDRELTVDDWCGLAGLVEEDTEAVDETEPRAVEFLRQLQSAVGGLAHEVRCGNSIFCLGEPLLFFTKTPQ